MRLAVTSLGPAVAWAGPAVCRRHGVSLERDTDATVGGRTGCAVPEYLLVVFIENVFESLLY